MQEDDGGSRSAIAPDPQENGREGVVRRSSSRSAVLFGASIGAGSAAHAVQQGGADFLLVANVGRLRMMGAPSCACHLPIRDCNELVMGYARSEILPAVDIPVYLGVAACDPRLDLGGHMSLLKECGFGGVSNFPTFSQMTGPFRETLEASGLGFCRELELLSQAKASGLSVLGYGGSATEIARLAELGADLICIQFDPTLGLTPRSSLDELEVAASLARPLIRYIRRNSPGTICLCGGAAVANPDRMFRLTKMMGADGYIGGSTIDQLPSQTSIEDRVAEFKAIAALRRRVSEEERLSLELERRFQLSTQSQQVRDLYAKIARAARKDCHILIAGESGTGKTHAVEAVQRLGPRSAKRHAKVPCDPTRAADLASDLFGSVAGHLGRDRARLGIVQSTAGGTLVLEGLEAIPLPTQGALLRMMEERTFRVLGASADTPIDVRLLFTSRFSPDDLLARGLIIQELYLRLKPFSFSLPPLRERAEDIPMIVDRMLAALRARHELQVSGIEHAAVRHLQRQPWAGNLRDLATTLEDAAQAAVGRRIGLADLRGAASTPSRSGTERDWIMDALRRHKFRKGAAATFLGISRKTLYNKLKSYDVR